MRIAHERRTYVPEILGSRVREDFIRSGTKNRYLLVSSLFVVAGRLVRFNLIIVMESKRDLIKYIA